MTAPLNQRLQDVLEKHRPYGLDCKCGQPINSDAMWSSHAADHLTDLLIDMAGCGELLASIARMYR